MREPASSGRKLYCPKKLRNASTHSCSGLMTAWDQKRARHEVFKMSALLFLIPAELIELIEYRTDLLSV